MSIFAAWKSALLAAGSTFLVVVASGSAPAQTIKKTEIAYYKFVSGDNRIVLGYAPASTNGEEIELTLCSDGSRKTYKRAELKKGSPCVSDGPGPHFTWAFQGLIKGIETDSVSATIQTPLGTRDIVVPKTEVVKVGALKAGDKVVLFPKEVLIGRPKAEVAEAFKGYLNNPAKSMAFEIRGDLK